MNVKNSFSYIPLTSFDVSVGSGSYQILNGNIPSPCFAFKIINNANVPVFISLDGITDHDFIPASYAQVYDLQTNKQPNGDTCLLPQGSKVYLKAISLREPGTGIVYFVGLTQIRGV